MANVRETGTEISWHGCDFIEAKDDDDNGGFVEHTCNTLDDLPEMNCKRFSSEKSKFLQRLLIQLFAHPVCHLVMAADHSLP